MNNKSIEKSISIDGFSLYTNIIGDGIPAVVLVSGYGETSETWRLVQPEIAKFTKAISYDRDGLGRSDRSEKERDSETTVRSLHRLLKEAGVNGPYIMVGHSFGTLCIRLYADRYPEDVAALVLVDPTPELLESKYIQTMTKETRESFYNNLTNEGTLTELRASFEQVKGIQTKLGMKPLIIISAGIADYHTVEGYRIWLELHKDMLEFSSNSKQIIASNSSHHIHLQQPEVVSGAIHEVYTILKKEH